MYFFRLYVLFFLSEHAELQQPKLLLGARAERELSGSLHEDGDRNSAAGQYHHHPAAQRETGTEVLEAYSNMTNTKM